jgi:hypothetical protein
MICGMSILLCYALGGRLRSTVALPCIEVTLLDLSLATHVPVALTDEDYPFIPAYGARIDARNRQIRSCRLSLQPPTASFIAG